MWRERAKPPQRYVGVSSALPLEEIGTVWFQGMSLAIDHLYRARDASGESVPGSFRVVRDAPGSGLAGSDHAAVQADFTLPSPIP